MQPATHIEKSYAIAFDADVLAQPQNHHFDEAYWRDQDAVYETAKGRGNSWFIDSPFGRVVLRRYFGGGWAARFSRDHYFYLGVIHSRPFQEFAVLVSLLSLGLPVPKPVAALCEHKGLFYRGALITQAIEGARTLADFLPTSDGHKANRDINDENTNIWQDTGRCIRRFHDAGLWHADLNARNILIDGNQEVHLIDFDRARLTPDKPVDGQNNLARLKRSLKKIGSHNGDEFLSSAWAKLMEGYND